MRVRLPSPALRRMPKSIAASTYNQVRLALHRIDCPLRIAVPGHRGLEVILSDHVWFCVDANADDQPVMAWLDFATQGRDNLQAPVACTLEFYHNCAGLVMGSVPDALESALAALLQRTSAAP